MPPRYAWLLTITRRDTTMIRVTSATDSVTVADLALTWVPAEGLKIGDLSTRNDGTLPSFKFDIAAQSGSVIELADVDNGLYDQSSFELRWTDANNPLTSTFTFEGVLGNGNYDLRGLVSFEALSLYAVPRDIFVRQYGIPCDADFGDARRCKIPTWPDREVGSDDLHDVGRTETIAVGGRRRFRFASAGDPSDYHNVYLEATAITTGITSGSAPTISDVDAATSTDGGVTWTTRNAWVRYAQIGIVIDERDVTLDALPDPRASDVTWFVPGRIVMRSGYMTNTVSKVTAWNPSTLRITLAEPIGDFVLANDWLEIAPDCDKSLVMCFSKYDNVANYRGFPHLTGDKVTTSTVIPGVTTFPGPTDDPPADYFAAAVEFAGGSS